MKSGPLRIALLGIWLVLAGCQTGTGGGAAGDEKTFAAEPGETLQEVWALLKEQGYQVRVLDRAGGRLEAFSPVRADAPFGDAVQRRVRVAVSPEGPGESRVVISATALEESGIPVHGRAVFERPLRDPWYYQRFFQELAARLEPR